MRFRHPAMDQFTRQQVRYTPQERKLVQLDRAEDLLAEIDVNRAYPYQYVCFRVTDYRSDAYPDLLLPGDELVHDLRLFIEELSASASISMSEAGEPVLTVEEVSDRYKISTKTVNRWRQRGLVSRRFVVDGRQRVGFLQSSIDRFVSVNSQQVDRGSRFSQLTDEEKQQIIHRARRFARCKSATLAEVSRRIGTKLGRSPETIRYTIKNYDQQHPQQAIFPAVRGPLDSQTKQSIYRSYRGGTAIEDLAETYHRTRSSIYRIINEVRTERILSQPIEYMYHESFDDPEQAEEIPRTRAGQGRAHTNGASTGRAATLPAESVPDPAAHFAKQERYLFRKMNYLLQPRQTGTRGNRLGAGQGQPAR